MDTYYLGSDNETIYKIEFSIKEKDRAKYLSLLEKYLEELVFSEETEYKKLVEEDKIEEENQEGISIENHIFFLHLSAVIEKQKIEDYLPWIVTVKKKKYSFLRSYTIFMLMALLSDDLDKVNNSYSKQIEKLMGCSRYINFSFVLSFFFDSSGGIIPERGLDYHSFLELLQNLEGKIIEKYSKSFLASFWQGDEAEREIADGIVGDSAANKVAIKRLNFDNLINGKI